MIHPDINDHTLRQDNTLCSLWLLLKPKFYTFKKATVYIHLIDTVIYLYLIINDPQCTMYLVYFQNDPLHPHLPPIWREADNKQINRCQTSVKYTIVHMCLIELFDVQ